MVFPTFKVTGRSNRYNIDFSLYPLLHWTPLGVSVKWEEQIWHLNMKSIEFKSPVSIVYNLSSGRMDLCTLYGIWDTARALANCRHPTFSGTFAVVLYSVTPLHLSLILKLKLNSKY